jgi:enterochelin esterase family protein
MVLSLLAILAAVQAAAGKVEERAVHDSRAGRERRVWIYTPPGYQPKGAAYPLIVAFDGEMYLDPTIPLPKMLDTLLGESKAPAFVAVLVDNGARAARLDDLANRAPFASFLADELMPWVRSGWNVTRDPRRTVVVGSSAGGLAAAYVALAHPELFGNVLSQSGAFWRGNEASNEPPYEWLTERYASSPARPIRFFLEVGALEDHRVLGGTGPNMRDANRRFRDALQAKGYAVSYGEVPNGVHSPEDWARRLPDLIARAAKSIQ